MPRPNLATHWRGHTPTTDEPGAYRLLRTISSPGTWTEINLRSSDYAGASDGVAQNADGDQRGIIKSIALLNNSTSSVERVQVSFSVVSGVVTPSNAYNVVLPNGPSVELRCGSHPSTTRFYIKSESGTPELQLELWYDVPPAS
jgi:hypothetical protein